MTNGRDRRLGRHPSTLVVGTDAAARGWEQSRLMRPDERPTQYGVDYA